MTKWAIPLNQGSQLLNRQWLIGAADVGDKQDVRETRLECSGNGVQQPGFLAGHPAGFERLPLRDLFLVFGSMLLARAVSESGEQVRRDPGNLVAERNFQDDPTTMMNAGGPVQSRHGII